MIDKMTRRALARRLCAGLVPIWAGAAMAQTVGLARLQQLVRQAPKRELRFHESRESPWLAAPLESSGRMRSDATMLEKNVELPRPETWRILDDRMLRLAPGDADTQILFSQAPAAAALAIALRRAVAGELEALERDFRIAPSGDEQRWTLQLTPRRPEIARFLKLLELQGSGASLNSIMVLESQGGRSTTRLSNAVD